MKLLKQILLTICLLLLIGGTLFIGVGYFNYRSKINEVSVKDMVAEVQSNPNYVTYANIDQDVLEATVSIEDRRFYEHHGIDYLGMGRALVGNIFAKGITGGGSTITQQLAKNLYFTQQPSYIRKVSEIFVAYDLEKLLSKQEILELYVNVINYGDNHFGIKQASEGYFQKDPSDLTLDEASLLAGLPQSPSNLQLSNHMDAARVRQKQVLDAMRRDGHITQSQSDGIGAASE